MISLGYVEHPLNDRFVRGCDMECWTLEFLLRGRTLVRCAQSEQLCKAPSVLLVPPQNPYAVEWAGPGERWTEIYAIFDPPIHWQSLFSWLKRADTISTADLPDLTTVAELETALQQALEEQRSSRIHRHHLMLNLLERFFLLLEEINPAHGLGAHDARIERVLEHISEYYSQSLSLNYLARQAFLSPSRFSHLFKTQTGQAPMQYLDRYRLERAAEKLLTSQSSIEQIAQAVGFTNAFHFSTRFRRHFRRSPSAYRRNPK